MKREPVKYYIDEDNRFVIEGYNWAEPFSNFLPGIAGKWGIPLWVYYINRSQGVCSVGVRDKDHQILEFLSFNKACQVIPRQGFRTFLKLGNGAIHEPFRKTETSRVRQKMIISSGELEIRETHQHLKLRTEVSYFPLVNYPLPALVRRLRLINTGRKPLKVELVDGISRIFPSGVDLRHITQTARHIEGMMGVEEVGGAPIFRLRQTAADVERIGTVSGGNFYFSFSGGGLSPGKYIVDPFLIFGSRKNYDYPWSFRAEDLENLLTRSQLRRCQTPCAFTALPLRIAPGKEYLLSSLIGYAPEDKLLRQLMNSVKKKDFIAGKRRENLEVIDRIKNLALTVSSSREFDQYCQQDFLDNVIRGGLPLVFRTARGKSVFYLYSRQNGDLERDYHYFVLEPTYLSQGNGHYRSVHQNRRMDNWFFPEVEDANLLTFMNLIQLDGYNPLEVTGLTFTADNLPKLEKWLKKLIGEKEICRRLLELVREPFTPGEFIMALEKDLRIGRDRYPEILSRLLACCRQHEVGALHEGFWIDHWTYNLDLIDSFLMIYPDRLHQLLLGRRNYTFFDDPDTVLPRQEKYVLVGEGVRRYGAVMRDREKEKLIGRRGGRPHTVRTADGRGKIYTTTLFVKLLCVAANRISTLDPAGRGMEMEADKPGWNDSMNGLPGLVGSSLGETLELLRLCRFLFRSLGEMELDKGSTVPVYKELADFIRKLNKIIDRRLKSKARRRAFIFWDASHTLLEEYRAETRLGINGGEEKMKVKELRSFLDRCLQLLESIFRGRARKKVTDENGIPYTYFINEVIRFEPLWKDKKRKIPRRSHDGYPLVRPLAFRQRPLPLFLEGPVHYLRLFPEEGPEIYRSLRRSGVFDRKLKMYKSCQSLENETFEIGRVKAYPRGWIENESIYLHMEYKYLLELARSGCFREFYRDLKTALVCFNDPAVYGRSIMEGASFIASSAFPDKKYHGRAFQPRLSGITCEMLHIWTLLVAGPRPFYLDREGKLRMELRPALASWLFTRRKVQFRYFRDERSWKKVILSPGSFAFRFLGKTLVVYHNDARKNTFGNNGARVRSYSLLYRNGKKERVKGGSLGSTLARKVREGKVSRIDVELA